MLQMVKKHSVHLKVQNLLNLCKAHPSLCPAVEVDAQEASMRVGNDGTRPLFTNRDAVDALLEKRGSLYKEVADLTVDTTARDIPEIAAEIHEELVAAGILSFA